MGENVNTICCIALANYCKKPTFLRPVARGISVPKQINTDQAPLFWRISSHERILVTTIRTSTVIAVVVA